MHVSTVLEQRYARTPDGAVWSTAQCAYDFWARYLQVFDGVDVVARVKDVGSVPERWVRVDGDGVRVTPIPTYIGPRQYVLQSVAIRKALSTSINPASALILRLPSMVASSIPAHIFKNGRPYGVEVVANPTDVFASGASRHPLRAFFRWYFARELARFCANAVAVTYVSSRVLPVQYPANGNGLSCVLTDAELGNEAFVSEARTFGALPKPLRLVTVGSLQQPYKGVDLLIQAAHQLTQAGVDVHVTVVGEGQYRSALEQQARALGLGECICFTGQLPSGQAVRNELDKADLFVLASRAEALGRALLEAMARGLPCIGSDVGGIPELLSTDNLVPPGSSTALANKIFEYATSPAKLNASAYRSLQVAYKYHDRERSPKQRAYLTYLRDATQQWLQSEQIALRNG
ncbi:MAG: glycosyltransferase [Caldilineaceae bacterium]